MSYKKNIVLIKSYAFCQLIIIGSFRLLIRQCLQPCPVTSMPLLLEIPVSTQLHCLAIKSSDENRLFMRRLSLSAPGPGLSSVVFARTCCGSVTLGFPSLLNHPPGMNPLALRPKSSESILSRTGSFLLNFLAKGVLLSTIRW